MQWPKPKARQVNIYFRNLSFDISGADTVGRTCIAVIVVGVFLAKNLSALHPVGILHPAGPLQCLCEFR